MDSVTASNNVMSQQQSRNLGQSIRPNPKDDDIPIAITSIHVPRSLTESKKLEEISQKMPDIDADEIVKIAHHFNNMPKGSVISMDVIAKAIKGLNYEGFDFPKETQPDPSLKSLDEMIENTTKKVLALNTAFLVLDPNVTLSRLPMPVLKTQKKAINDLFFDDKKILPFMRDNMPVEAREIFNNNVDVMQKTPNSTEQMSKITEKIKIAPEAIKKQVASTIENEMANLYQLTAIRLLATLGNHSTGTPNIQDTIKIPDASYMVSEAKAPSFTKPIQAY